MPKQVNAYEADDGSLHTSECEAATVNVSLLVQRSPLAENQPYARKLVEWLTGNPQEIRAVLEAHERACPKVVEDVDASKRLERTREYKPSPIPRGHDPLCKSHAAGDFAYCDCFPSLPDETHGDCS
jgi:hypothetical protein